MRVTMLKILSAGIVGVSLLSVMVACTLSPENGHREPSAPLPPWTREAGALLLTPKSDCVAPVAVMRTEGRVDASDALFAEDGKSCRLSFDMNGTKPFVVLDFGKQSVGGYAVFTVTAKTGRPVVRLAYACHPAGLSETGCFTRETSARYLGATLDLPVLPANVNRHELYTIPRTGRFIAPLIQGQTRYVRVQLDTPGTSVDIDAVTMVNSDVYDRSPNDGFFLCSDDRLNKLWAISAWTLQIASFPNHDAWKVVDGWLLPRKLEQSDDVGLCAAGRNWHDVTISTCFELRTNPHHVSAAGIAFRAHDVRNAYLAEVALDGRVRLVRRVDGHETVIAERQVMPLTDGVRYKLEIMAHATALTVRLDGQPVLAVNDACFTTGRVGFYTPKECWPLFDEIRISDGAGKVLLADDFSGELSQWEFARTLPYVADGAKRDRLVWSGDLYWAERNIFYAFAGSPYLRDSLKMLAFNQTPEGYVHASPYPERHVPPASHEYGPFPSDEFAAWLVPVAWDYLLYTDDVKTLREIYPAIQRLLSYLGAHMGANGLYAQRVETSKHAGNLNLGDVRTRSYMNVLLWGAYADAAHIADRLRRTSDAADYRRRAETLKRALFSLLWNDKQGCFTEALETPGFGSEANALALSMRLVTQEQALRVAPQFKKVGHGKFQSLVSRGKFEYGFSQSGLQTLFDHNWLKLLEDGWRGAWTTTECMGMIQRGWGDESHPDTAIASLFSAYILGVEPVEPGYRCFKVRPQPVNEVTWAKGVVPTPHGSIRVEWDRKADRFTMLLTVPKECVADAVMPASRRLLVNGKPGMTHQLKEGTYLLEAVDVLAGAYDDPSRIAGGFDQHNQKRVLKSSSSHEMDGWGIANLFASEQDTSKKGYRSTSHPTPDAQEWIEIDLGEDVALSKVCLLPSADAMAVGERAAGFPVDFTVELAKNAGVYTVAKKFVNCSVSGSDGVEVDLYTVIGYPTVRYLRIAATRLGKPAREETDRYRLQLGRMRLIRP